MKTLIKEINIINEGIIQFPILPNGSGWKSTEEENLSVIESGEAKVLLSKIIKAIDISEKMVCLQSFLIQDTAIIDALLKAVSERQVKVFILSSAEARLKDTIEEEQDFIKASYIQLLDTKFKNNFIHRTAENFHGKYILIDPITNPAGFICTNNFTENGFTKNPELAVQLNKEQCEELFKVFIYHFWEHSTDEQTATNEFSKVKPVNKFSLPKPENILLTSPNSENNSLNKTLVKAVQQAKKSISVSTFLLDKNTELVKAILEKAKQNISIMLFCRLMERQFNEELKDLLDAGIQIYFHPLTHSKSLLIDSNEGFIFTANLISNGLNNGFEVGIKLNNEQTKDLAIIHHNWQENFPIKAIKVANIKDLKEYEVFRNGKLSKTIPLENEKELKKKIDTVEDLFNFYHQKFEVKNSSIKSTKFKLIAEIEDLPTEYKLNNSEKFEVIEVAEEKGKKCQIVVIKKSFIPDDIHQLASIKELKLYCA